MTATPTWPINTLDRSLPDGTVTTTHWTVSLTEDNGLSAYETSLAQQIDEQRNPTQATGLPWA